MTGCAAACWGGDQWPVRAVHEARTQRKLGRFATLSTLTHTGLLFLAD
jgi:hypothetical protein